MHISRSSLLMSGRKIRINKRILIIERMILIFEFIRKHANQKILYAYFNYFQYSEILPKVK